ncbi:MAG TPA: hypothetical protein VFW48_00815 [Solirubrobacterales bacterium]|nr:hypothetical protein [Solirubrobacterales bacterium]
MEVAAALSTLGAGLIGIILGALLARRNEKRAQGERLLVEALNDAATAIAEVAGGEGKSAQNRYASAMSRIALHASPRVVSQFREFQNDPTTATQDGRTRLINAVQQARLELGHGKASDEDLAVLLFGDVKPDKRFFAQCDTWLSAMDFPTRLAIEREADRAAQSLKSTMQEKSDR